MPVIQSCLIYDIENFYSQPFRNDNLLDPPLTPLANFDNYSSIIVQQKGLKTFTLYMLIGQAFMVELSDLELQEANTSATVSYNFWKLSYCILCDRFIDVSTMNNKSTVNLLSGSKVIRNTGSYYSTKIIRCGLAYL